MFALARFARSAPRAAARFSAAAATARPPVLVRACLARPAAAAFSQMARLRGGSSGSGGSGLADELVAKLQSEISLEEDMQDDDDLSANIKEYLENSPFALADQPGHHEVVLTRTFGDETIRITFTTADLDSSPTDDDLQDDGAAYDDGDLAAQPGTAASKGTAASGAPPVGEDGEVEYEDDGQQHAFPAHATIHIERSGKGALSIEATAQDGDFVIQDLVYFPTADLADPATAEHDWQRRTLYTGPPFNNLDEDLQILLEKYLEERGINTRLALFIPDYIDHKEQKEYIRWLNNVKNFVA